MIQRHIAPLCLVLCASNAAIAQDTAVDVELVLAIDISGSVDAVESQQQRQGYVEAIAHPDVVRAIGATFTGRIGVTYVEWAGADTQYTIIPWRVIDGEAAARAFAGELAEAPTQRAMWTSISGAIDYAVPLFEANGLQGERRVIDISGDGTNNRGRDVRRARDMAVADGIIINGLPILNDRPQPFDMPTPMEIGLDRYYADNVIGGPGSFLVPALSFAEFKEAILQKLILEIAGEQPPRRLAGR